MNKEDYVSLEVAKLLEEKGYREKCSTRYISDGKGIVEFESWLGGNVDNGKMKDGYLYDYYLAPSLYDMQKWLCKKHNIYITTMPLIPLALFGEESPEHLDYAPIVIHKDKDGKWIYKAECTERYDALEEALNVCVKKALKLI